MDNASHIWKLFADREPGRFRMVMNGITETIGGSFIADKATPTKAEIGRRFDICTKWFMVMYRDLKWATVRCLDDLPKALRCELDGIPYTPTREGKSSWGADNARDLVWLPN